MFLNLLFALVVQALPSLHILEWLLKFVKNHHKSESSCFSPFLVLNLGTDGS